MLQLHATKKERIKVEVSERDVFELVEAKIRAAHSIRPDQWLVDGKLYHKVLVSRGWDEHDGPATDQQIAGFALIESLHKVLLPEPRPAADSTTP
jgi:hypothetical protein